MSERHNQCESMQFSYFFPSTITSDLEQIKDVLNLRLNQERIAHFSVLVDGEKILIPERVYCSAEEKAIAFLSPLQKQMASCILTRHHDGFVREEALRQIIQCNESWVAPYIVGLLGDYVVEILEVLEENAPSLDHDIYANFIRDNAVFFNLAASRAVSYWNCNSRRSCPDKNQYVGVKALKLLKQFS